MASKEARQKKEEALQIFNEVWNDAWVSASPIKRQYLEQQRTRFLELTERKKTKKEEADHGE